MTRLRAVFEGKDASGNENLWVTDGTSAGTSELTPAGAYSSGVFYNEPRSADLTAFGGRALFKGVDASLLYNLWVTDGTSVGTSELTVAGPIPLGCSTIRSTRTLPFSAARRYSMAWTRAVIRVFG
jgi:ELWxxDGT repeat protein